MRMILPLLGFGWHFSSFTENDDCFCDYFSVMRLDPSVIDDVSFQIPLDVDELRLGDNS